MERELVAGWEFDVGNWQWEVAGADPEIMAFYSQAQALVRAATLEDLESDGIGVSKRSDSGSWTREPSAA